MTLEIPGIKKIFKSKEERVIKRKRIRYITIPGITFKETDLSAGSLNYNADGTIIMTANGFALKAPVFLPHNAKILAVKGFGSATDETWKLTHNDLLGTGDIVMASANFGSEDTSIIDPIVSELETYQIFTSTLDLNDTILGIRIQYAI